jgi:hypothetical protein
MKQRLFLTLIVLLTAAVVISACSGTQQPAPTPAAMSEESMDKDAMAKDDKMAGEESMDKEGSMEKEEAMEKDDSMAKEESMGSDDAMKKDDSMASEESMEKSEDAMDKNDESMSSEDSMEKKEGDMDSDDAMEKDDSMAKEEGMEKSDENKSSEDGMMKATLTLTLTNLPDLGPDWAYEGWLIVEGQPVSTGVFTVDEKGMASTTEFPVDAEALKKATAFVLTIEPHPDDDPAPSPIHILGGDFDGDAANLTVGHPLALGVDFADTSVSYILGAPSSENAKADYAKGIWWPGLKLPQLPQGWVYEGWVVGPDGPISTGRFTSGDMADSDGVGPTGGPKAGPNFPGQDFINPPIDLTSGYAVVISIEPEPDNSPLPFALKRFIDENIEDVGDHGSQTMETRTEGFPTGEAQR